MMNGLLFVLTLLAALGCAMMAGVFFEEANRPGLPPGRAAPSCEPLQGRGLLLRPGWPPPCLGSQLPRGGVGRRRSDGVWRPSVEGTRTGGRTSRERRTENVPNAAPPALERHPRADGARRAAGGSQTARWPGIGPDVGTKEARRTPPQASEDLMECRLGTGETSLVGQRRRTPTRRTRAHTEGSSRPIDCPRGGARWMSLQLAKRYREEVETKTTKEGKAWLKQVTS